MINFCGDSKNEKRKRGKKGKKEREERRSELEQGVSKKKRINNYIILVGWGGNKNPPSSALLYYCGVIRILLFLLKRGAYQKVKIASHRTFRHR